MICEPCQWAALHNRTWRTLRRDDLLVIAQRHHAACTGCCCQHAIGVDSLAVTPL